MNVSNFGSDRLHVFLEQDADGYCESALWTAEGGEYVEELCPRGTMKDLCIALERRLPLVLAEEGLDPESWG